MGCDIHLYVEKKIDNKWQILDKLVKEEEEDGTTWYNRQSIPFYEGRNYDLFSILADVRNGYGFAGTPTGEGFVPIYDPRGVPNDASPEYKAVVKNWDCDGHSHSYHTLRQLLNYDWTQTTTKQGWCSMKEWEQWASWGRPHGKGPESYCGSIIGANISHISAAEADALFSNMSWKEREDIAEAHQHTYALATWEAPYYRQAQNFLSETIPKLIQAAGGIEEADNIRIVFFFDN